MSAWSQQVSGHLIKIKQPKI